MMDLWNVSETELMNTSSCLTGSTDKPCGRCVVCARRAGIFRQLGFDEEYETEPFEASELQEMYLEMYRGFRDENYKCHYDKYRRDEIIPSFLTWLDDLDNYILHNQFMNDYDYNGR
jgi:hypothetical protein